MTSMHLTITAAAISAAATHAAKAVETRSTISILASVRLDAADGRMTLTASDMKRWLTLTVAGADVREPGVCCVDAARFRAALRAAQGDDEVTLRLGAELSVRHPRGRYRLPVLDAGAFPTTEPVEAQWSLRLPGPALRAALERVEPAISTEDTRYYLNGVHLLAQGRRLRLAVTDGHRGHVTWIDPEGLDGAPELILPHRAVRLLIDLAGEGEVRIHGDDRRIAVDTGPGVAALSSRLIDGTFPDIDRVIPKEAPASLTVDGEELAAAIKAVVTMADDKARCVVLRAAGEEVLVGCSGAATGTGVAAASAVVKGAIPDIGFNARYLTEVMTGAEGEVEFGVTDAGAPVMVRIDGLADDTRVIMPMRVGAFPSVEDAAAVEAAA